MTSTYLLHVYGTSWHEEIQAAPSHGGIIANTLYCKNCMFFSPHNSFQMTRCHSSGGSAKTSCQFVSYKIAMHDIPRKENTSVPFT